MPAAPHAPNQPDDTPTTAPTRTGVTRLVHGRQGIVAGVVVLLLGAAGITALAVGLPGTGAEAPTPKPATGLLPSGRQLTPQGTQVTLGNLPTGGAVTADGRFLWTVSAGFGSNDVRIVDTAQHRVVPDAGPARRVGWHRAGLAHRLAYVSGLHQLPVATVEERLPGAQGQRRPRLQLVGHLREGEPAPGHPGSPAARRADRADVPPDRRAGPDGAPQRSNSGRGRDELLAAEGRGLARRQPAAGGAQPRRPRRGDRPEQLRPGAVRADRQLPVRRGGPARTGAPAWSPTRRPGRCPSSTCEAATKLADITVGPPLSHPQGVVVDRAGARAYVALSNSDQVVVVDLKQRSVERTISVGRSAGLGTMPVAVALVAERGPPVRRRSGRRRDRRHPPARSSDRAELDWTVVGRIPIADDPQAVVTVAAQDGRPAQLMWVAAKGVDVGPNPNGPNPVIYSDPIFWAFNPVPPTTDVFDSVGYTAALVRGRAGLMTLPSDAQVEQLTPAAARQLQPVGATDGPGRHAAARRRADQARLLHRAREPRATTRCSATSAAATATRSSSCSART